jgi:hypothetical protein
VLAVAETCLWLGGSFCRPCTNQNSLNRTCLDNCSVPSRAVYSQLRLPLPSYLAGSCHTLCRLEFEEQLELRRSLSLSVEVPCMTR